VASSDKWPQNALPMSSPSLRTAAAGFTLIELMIAVALVAILAGIAAPSVREFMSGVQLTGIANDLYTDLNLARSEAVKRDVRMTMCPSRDGLDCDDGGAWTDGWVVVVDANGDGKKDSVNDVLKRGYALTSHATLTLAGGTKASFGPTGVAVGAPPVFNLCDPSPSEVARKKGNGRTISVSTTGRPSITKVNCP
jgi:type IV fimbrial biogenesis protein FimT